MQEWQHFTNPTLRLLLDMKISQTKELESVRLRIIWSINPTVDAEVGQQDVVFEDMDLLSFSSITAPVARKHQTEGLPLKAVYRDTVVGIRYFHGREDGITPVYRRFQISFQSAQDASDFIALIKPVCPCRLNPTSAPSFAASQAQFINNVNVPHTQVQTRLPSSNPLLPNRGSPFTYSLTTNDTTPIAKQTSFAQPITQPSVERPPLPRSLTLFSSPQRQEPPSDPEFYPPVTSGRPLFPPIPPIPLLAAPQTSSSHQTNAPRETSNVGEHSSAIPDINVILSQRINPRVLHYHPFQAQNLPFRIQIRHLRIG
ncbi:hypothetical protein BJ912DRAFT_46598 [Pholiota molesta]|nr:hypothetical protein BJ912DRAFT_46598 [Pholiota molesta]